jgi:hypothetical protein
VFSYNREKSTKRSEPLAGHITLAPAESERAARRHRRSEHEIAGTEARDRAVGKADQLQRTILWPLASLNIEPVVCAAKECPLPAIARTPRKRCTASAGEPRLELIAVPPIGEQRFRNRVRSATESVGMEVQHDPRVRAQTAECLIEQFGLTACVFENARQLLTHGAIAALGFGVGVRERGALGWRERGEVGAGVHGLCVLQNVRVQGAWRMKPSF